MQLIKNIIINREVFSVVDESSIGNIKYINILIGTLENPQTTYLIETLATTESVDNVLITQTINDTMHNIGITKEKLILLISDASSYMTKAAQTLKILYPNMIHITCLLRLLNNCALKIKANYPSIDNLISSVKAATVKNNSRRELFLEIGYPPMPVVTRWGTWLEAVNYYAINFPIAKGIIREFSGNGILVLKCLNAVENASLEEDLLNVSRCYSEILSLIDKFKLNF